MWTAVDAKPKSTRSLRLLANIESTPRVSILTDECEDDWPALWGVYRTAMRQLCRSSHRRGASRFLLGGEVPAVRGAGPCWSAHSYRGRQLDLLVCAVSCPAPWLGLLRLARAVRGHCRAIAAATVAEALRPVL